VEEHGVAIRIDDMRVLKMIQRKCTNLSTLTIPHSSMRARVGALEPLYSPQVVAEVLALVNACFRVVSSQAEIILEMYEDSPCPHMEWGMESYGWTIKVVHPFKAFCEDLFFVSFAEDDYNLDFDDSDDDIDNDSG